MKASQCALSPSGKATLGSGHAGTASRPLGRTALGIEVSTLSSGSPIVGFAPTLGSTMKGRRRSGTTAAIFATTSARTRATAASSMARNALSSLASRIRSKRTVIAVCSAVTEVCSRVAAITLSASSREAAICLLAMMIVAATVPKAAARARTPAMTVCQWSSRSSHVVKCHGATGVTPRPFEARSRCPRAAAGRIAPIGSSPGGAVRAGRSGHRPAPRRSRPRARGSARPSHIRPARPRSPNRGAWCSRIGAIAAVSGNSSTRISAISGW